MSHKRCVVCGGEDIDTCIGLRQLKTKPSVEIQIT